MLRAQLAPRRDLAQKTRLVAGAADRVARQHPQLDDAVEPLLAGKESSPRAAPLRTLAQHLVLAGDDRARAKLRSRAALTERVQR